MNATWTLRDATQADLPAIVAIYNQTIPGRMVTADLGPVSVEQRQVWFAAHSPDKHPLWVAERDIVKPDGLKAAGFPPVSSAPEGSDRNRSASSASDLSIEGATKRVVGWLSYSAFHSRAAYDMTAELSIYIDETERGRGLGRYLLERSIAHAPSIGVVNLVGLIFGHNTPSLALFERFGFARWGTLPDVAELDGVRRTLVIVGRTV